MRAESAAPERHQSPEGSIFVDRWQFEQLVMSEHGPSEPSLRLVLVAVVQWQGHEKHEAYPSQDTIAKRCGLSVRQVKRWLKVAVERGWLRVSKRHSKGERYYYNVYLFAIPERLIDLRPEHPWEKDPAWKRRVTRDTQSSNAEVSSTTLSQDGMAPNELTSRRDGVTSQAGLSDISSMTVCHPRPNGVTSGAERGVTHGPQSLRKSYSEDVLQDQATPKGGVCAHGWGTA